METVDQMLSALRAVAAQASGKAAEARGRQDALENSVDFAQALRNSIDRVNQAQQNADALAENFAAGEGNVDLHEVMLSLQKANISFQEMVQVRNKLVTAYHDVMNMPV
ncbi:MAG: flagellar hook-basal body complex protein FliE [Candidatus Accumulibacter sp.]|jgi:flagellar hook-basal body complex protein FliE|nr:flagellar hook-basal body complex protein FliE [Accumulibacter sp.]